MVELPVEFRLHILVGHLLGQVTMEERAVEATYHIEVHHRGILGVEGHLHPLHILHIQVDASRQVIQRGCRPVQYGRFANTVYTTQDVHVATQVPHDMLAPPQRLYLDALYILGPYSLLLVVHSFSKYCFRQR